jgi:hypothetical protein
MPRPATKAAKRPAKPSRLKDPARQVAVDADRVRRDLGQLLLSLEDLSVEELRQVSDRALALVAKKTGGEKRSVIGAALHGAASLGESIAELFSKSEPVPMKRRARKRAKLGKGREVQTLHGPRSDNS